MPKFYCDFPHSLCGSTMTRRLDAPPLPPFLQSPWLASTAQIAVKSLPIIFSLKLLIFPPSDNILHPAPTSSADKFKGLTLSSPLLLTHSGTYNLSSQTDSFCSVPALISMYYSVLHQEHLTG